VAPRHAHAARPVHHQDDRGPQQEHPVTSHTIAMTSTVRYSSDDDIYTFMQNSKWRPSKMIK
jgi:hypothetical protein